ncbi:GNAT family N-acetyltransferase [Sphingomonas sp. PB4P5]|uniref:GNAT family N-acetyltransferase n=1 Tax=Parasphingomonas puruogangriensis TaxID=3096155 RepID=UPI002FCAB586
MVQIVPLADIPAAAVEQLLDAAFGPDRHGRTAYRIRDAMPALADLSFAAAEEGVLVGTIQCWPIALDGDDGTTVPLVMVGPVAVSPHRQDIGIGRLLIHHALEAADATGQGGALMLIGDPDYYGRLFGFSAAQTGGWRVPGPVERHRLLARGPGVPGGAGMLGPRIAVDA